MKRKAPEQALQQAVARYLELALPKYARFTAFPAGGGGRVRGARLKAMGLAKGVPDILIFWDDQQTGLRLKTRPDAWHENMTVDLKTIASADPRSFQNAMAQRGYHIQSAMNREGIRAATGKDVINHVFVCVEKTFPFLVAVYILDETALDHAHNTLRKVLPEMKECLNTQVWAGYETMTIGLPAWMREE